MRPTDKEIKIQKKRHPISSAVDKTNEHVFEEGFKKGARWARDHDPWNYVEDGGLPPYSTDVIVVSTNNVDVLVAELRCGSEDYWEDSDTDRFSLSWVKCWMHIPQRKR
jgi:hypothetical protein